MTLDVRLKGLTLFSRALGILLSLALSFSFVVASSVPANSSGTTCTVGLFDEGGSGNTLRQCLNGVTTANLTVDFNHGGTAKTISLSTPITITAPGLTISDPDNLVTIEMDSGADGDIFLIDLDNSTQSAAITTFRGVTLSGAASSGRAVNAEDPTAGYYPLRFENATVKDFDSSSVGGAVNAGSVVVVESVFENNQSSASGGAIHSETTVAVSESSFINNSAGGSGGAIRSSETTTATNSNFYGNSATSQGGAIRSSGAVTITGGVFGGNKADGTGEEEGVAGAVFTSDGGLIEDSIFSSNTTENDSGAVHSEDSKLTVRDSLFINNDSGDDGGAIRSNGGLEVSGSSFLGNTAVDKGGAIDNFGNPAEKTTIIDSYFGYNQAGDDGGAIEAESNLLVMNTTFSGNSSGADGGAIHSTESGTDSLFALSTFVNNSATNNGQSLAYEDNGLLLGNLFLSTSTDPHINTSGSNIDQGGNVSTSAETSLDSPSSKTEASYGAFGVGIELSPTKSFVPTVPINSIAAADTFVTQAMVDALDLTGMDIASGFTFPTTDQQGNARTLAGDGYYPGAEFRNTATVTGTATTNDTLVATMYEIENRSFSIIDDDEVVTGDEYFYRLTTTDGTMVDLGDTTGMTGPLTEADQDTYYVDKLNYSAGAYEWEWVVFFCEVGNEVTEEIPSISFSKTESPTQGNRTDFVTLWSSESFNAPVEAIESYQLVDLPSGYSPTSNSAFPFLTLADTTLDKRMTISAHNATAACRNGNATVANLKLAGQDASARSLDLSQEFEVSVGGADKAIDLVGRTVAVYGVSGPNYVPAASHFGMTRIIEPTSSATPTPAPYSGPIISSVSTTSSAITAQGGQELVITGDRLSSVSKVMIDGRDVTISSTTENGVVATVPAGLEPGTYDLVIESSIGNLTYLDAITVIGSTSVGCDSEPMSYWTTRISDTQAKVYIKCPEIGSKLRILHQTGGSGEYDVPFVKTISSYDDPSLVVNEFGIYVVRTVDLQAINRIRIRIDDAEVWKVRYNR